MFKSLESIYYDFFPRYQTKYKPVKNKIVITETEEQILNRYKSKKKRRKSKWLENNLINYI